MAWQGSACAADQKLPEVVFTEHSPGAPSHGTSTGEYSTTPAPEDAQQAKERGGWEQYRTGGDWWRRIPRGNPPRSPRRGRIREFQLEVLEEEVETIVLSKRRRQRSPGSAGTAGRRRGRSRSPVSSRVRGGEASEGSGWVG
jgi:hypothetical protein